jgi:hypothetical protein
MYVYRNNNEKRKSEHQPKLHRDSKSEINVSSEGCCNTKNTKMCYKLYRSKYFKYYTEVISY